MFGKRTRGTDVGRRSSLVLYGKTLLRSVVSAYLVILMVAFFTQRDLIYPVPRRSAAPKSPRGQLLALKSPEHRSVHAFYVPAAKRLPTVVLFHGNAEQLADQLPLVEDLADSGFGVYGVEYPGYGLSGDGRTTEANVYADTEVALLHLERELKVPRDQLVLMGRSLGTGVAAEVASRGWGRRLILISPYTAMGDLAQKTFPFLPARWLVLDRYDTRAKAAKIRQSTLIVHGDRDSIVPVAMGRQLAAAIPKATLLLVPDADHNDLYDVGGRELWQRIVDFAATGR